MPVIDLGVNFEDVKDLDVFEPLPEGTYEFIVGSVESKTAASGRPMLKWTLNINYEGKEHRLFMNTVLPWFHNGEMDAGGVFMLVGLTKALGRPWTGQQMVTEDYIGLPGVAEVVQKPKQVKQIDGSYADDPNAVPVNDIKKFIYSA